MQVNKRLLISAFISITIMLYGISSNQEYEYKEIATPVEIVNESIKYSVEDDINNYIFNNKTTFDFYTKMFGISLDDLTAKLIEVNQYNNYFVYEDIGNTGIKYPNLELNLIDYLSKLEISEPDLFNRKYIYNEVSKEYIYGLIDYFSVIYPNVDKNIAKAITSIETGNLNSTYMLKYNNICGILSNGNLVRFPNIEYGVYRYIKMLSTNYFGKGLNTVDTIGYVYNPIINSDGSKIANPNWVDNVSKLVDDFSGNKPIGNLIELLDLLRKDVQ